jgi:hypothetical protein
MERDEKVQWPTAGNPYRYVRTCAWMGPIVLVALILFWGVLGRNIPPYAASLDAQAIADHFRQHTVATLTGMSLTMLFGVLYLVWGMGITKVMEAVERDNDVLSRLQLWGAGYTTLVLVLPASIWLTAAFRPDTDPKLLQLLYDFGWIFFDLAYSLTMVQFIPLGVCFLSDRRPDPLIPRWVGWFSIWVAVMFVVLILMPFFKSGPFSRSGICNYWLEFSIFFLAMSVISIAILAAVKKLEQEFAARRGGTAL